jgi:hypothetical protein
MRRPARMKQPPIDAEPAVYNPDDWSLWYRSTPTGRENRVIWWCWACGYREKPAPWPVQEAQAHRTICPQCREHTIRFVAYEDGREDAVALKVIEEGTLPS